MTIEALPPAVITCPVLDCGWTLDASGPPPEATQQATLADVFGPGVYAAVAVTQRAWDLERQLSEHYRTHSTVDYVRTMQAQREHIQRLEREVSRAGGRAHAFQVAVTRLATAAGLEDEVMPDPEADPEAFRKYLFVTTRAVLRGRARVTR